LSKHSRLTAAAAESGDEHGSFEPVQLHDRPADPSVFGTDVISERLFLISSRFM